MKRCVLLGAIVVLAMLCGCGAGRDASAPSPPAASQGSSAAPATADADPDDDAPGTCGSVTCELDQFCEDLFKGHALDARGRPLDRKKCMPLPDSCKAKPTCACVTKQVASTHCTDAGGRVYVNDYPARR